MILGVSLCTGAFASGEILRPRFRERNHNPSYIGVKAEDLIWRVWPGSQGASNSVHDEGAERARVTSELRGPEEIIVKTQSLS